MRKTGEITEFDQLRLLWGFGFQLLKCFFNREKLIGAGIRQREEQFIQRNAFVVAAMFWTAFSSGLVHQNPPHRFSRGGEEMSPAVPVLRLLDVDEPNVRIVDERGRLQGLSRFLVRHLRRGEFAQLVLDQR